MLCSLIPLLALLPCLLAMDDAGHRQRRIYQVVTDRFARPDSVTTTCDVAAAKYCGGTYQAMIGKLDYIQGMGFDTVWISPIVQNIGGETEQGEAYHGYWTSNPDELVCHRLHTCLEGGSVGMTGDRAEEPTCGSGSRQRSTQRRECAAADA